MAITNSQQARQLYKKGKRVGFFAAGLAAGDDISPGTSTSGGSQEGGYAKGNVNNNQSIQDYYNGQSSLSGKTVITDQGAKDALGNNPLLQQGLDNAKKYKANEAKRKKEQEEEDKKRRKEEEKKAKKEKRDARRKETKAQKKIREMQLAAFKRLQGLEGYVDVMQDKTTFAGKSGIEAAKMAGYNLNQLVGPPDQTQFEYDDSRFRDPITGKIKDELTEMVNINLKQVQNPETKKFEIVPTKNILGQDKKPKFVEQLKADAIPGYDFSINPVKSNFKSGLGTLTSTSGIKPNDYGLTADTKFPSALKLVGDIIRPPTGLQAFNTLEEARKIQDLAVKFQGGDKSAYEEFQNYITRNKVPTTSGGGGNEQQTNPCLGPNPPAYCNVNNDPTDPADPRANFYGLSPRIGGSIFDFSNLAEGGRAGLAEGGMPYEGGIMDLESGRQMYFLGKLVKKVTRSVKKIAKSPIGKVALLAAGAGYGGFGPLKGLFSGVKGAGFLKGAGMKNFFLKEGAEKFALSNLSSKGIASMIGGASLLPLLMGQKEDDEFDIDAYYAANKLNPNAPLNMRIAGSQFAANGGLMRTGYAEGSKEPVAKEVMPLLDMDGQEMDLRAEGGFVPIGRMEKADDVPARLSKNEFVFTADAVRNAGEGDIDKGAEVMYNMMKNLESGGDVSEESQGLEGAREMFQTSQRLGEVI